MNFKILHITDLHVESPTGDTENLRRAHYKPFLSSLIEQIENSISGKVDLVIASGDFIHRGKLENFSHCMEILKYLAGELELSPNRIITCLGNHDYDRVSHIAEPKEARRPYSDFARNFNPSDVLSSDHLHNLYILEEFNTYILVLDSTYLNSEEGNPGNLRQGDIDRLFLIVQDQVPSDSTLLVVSHYPIDMPRKVSFVLEENGWPEKHLWKSANSLLYKINALRRKGGETVYFHGDGHNPDFWSYNSRQHSFLTGMIGGRHQLYVTDKEGKEVQVNKTTEVKVIDFINSTIPTVYSLIYRNNGFSSDMNTGHWDINTSGPRYIKEEKMPESEAQIVVDYEENPRRFEDSVTKVISDSIEDEIMNEIATRKLYAFGRYVTSEKYSSLGWVDIDSLMNNRNIFARCVEKSKEWLAKLQNGELNHSSTVFIGLDFWGSCLAAQVSVMTGISNYCVAMKAKGRYNVEFERLNSTLFDVSKSWKHVVLFSDVVSTGISIRNVADEILANLGDKKVNIYSMSIISDVSQNRSVAFDCFEQVGTFCSKLRLTVVENDKLPDDVLLPPTLDIR